MPTAEQYIKRIEYGDRIIKMRTKDLKHADTMRQLPIPANCMNWNLGHILVFRDVCLGAIDGESGADPAEYAIYGAGSDPLTESNADKAVPLETLLKRLDESSNRLKAALLSASSERFNEMYESHTGPQQLDDYLLFYLVVHEAVHLGQLEILEELGRA
ncbi:MAG: DinB family protein [Chloroflexota bacterium]